MRVRTSAASTTAPAYCADAATSAAPGRSHHCWAFGPAQQLVSHPGWACEGRVMLCCMPVVRFRREGRLHALSHLRASRGWGLPAGMPACMHLYAHLYCTHLLLQPAQRPLLLLRPRQTQGRAHLATGNARPGPPAPTARGQQVRCACPEGAGASCGVRVAACAQGIGRRLRSAGCRGHCWCAAPKPAQRGLLLRRRHARY